MTDLVEFLRARLDEDERAARKCLSVNQDRGEWTFHDMQVRDDRDHLIVKHTWPNEGDHITRHDPARVLREVEAKRRIVHAHAQPHECLALSGSGERSAVDGKPWELWEPAHTDDHGPCFVLRCLALPYADHPDYREEWRP